MPFQSRIITAIQRTALVLLCLSLAGANTMAVANYSRVAPDRRPTTLKLVNYIPLSEAEEARLAAEIVAANDSPQNPAAAQTQAQPKPSPTPGMSSAIAPQSDQGRQYGQPGFVGEPINLNVVNADIRDILNYITSSRREFVIDGSVPQRSFT